MQNKIFMRFPWRWTSVVEGLALTGMIALLAYNHFKKTGEQTSTPVTAPINANSLLPQATAQDIPSLLEEARESIPSCASYNQTYNNPSHPAAGKAQAMRAHLHPMWHGELRRDNKALAAQRIEALSFPLRLTPSGSFGLFAAEFAQLQQSLKVRYLPALSPEVLQDMLVNGVSNRADQDVDKEYLARYRSVSADIVFTVLPDDRGLEAAALTHRPGDPLHKIRLVTQSAPNLAYGRVDRRKGGLLASGALDPEAYKDYQCNALGLFFDSCLDDGCDVVVVPGFGLGAFAPEPMRHQMRTAFGEVLKELAHDYPKPIIFCAPSLLEVAQIRGESQDVPQNLHFLEKSSFLVAHYLAKRGLYPGLLNPGDSSCVPGQFWAAGHIALEEMLGLFSTLLLVQHPGANPKVGEVDTYIAMQWKKAPDQEEDECDDCPLPGRQLTPTEFASFFGPE